MDVEDVEEWVIWVKLKAFDAQSMVFEDDRTVGVVLEEDPSSLWEVTENTIERKCGALNQVEPVDISDLESLYSLDDEPSDSVLCTIAYSELPSDDDSDTDSLEGDSDFGVHMINPIPHVLPIQEDPPLPLAKIH
nr:putative zinc finger, CCHC-type [Tanacetum cinerariifolium]